MFRLTALIWWLYGGLLPNDCGGRPKQYLCFEHLYIYNYAYARSTVLGACRLVVRAHWQIMRDLRYSRHRIYGLRFRFRLQHSRRSGALIERVSAFALRRLRATEHAALNPAYAASGKEVRLFDGAAEHILCCAKIAPTLRAIQPACHVG